MHVGASPHDVSHAEILPPHISRPIFSGHQIILSSINGLDFVWQLDDWVLCRIYNKKGTIEKYRPPPASAVEADEYDEYEDTKPENLRGFTTASLLARTTAPAVGAAAGTSDFMHFSPADSMPRLQTDSSCSEQVVSAEVTAEVQSEPKWKCEWDSIFDFGSGGGSYLDAMDFRSSPVSGCVNHMSPLQEMFLHLQKPF